MQSDQQRRQQIQQKAYQLWEQGPRAHGNDLAHWLQAEREVVEHERTVQPAGIEIKRPRRAAPTSPGNPAPKAGGRAGSPRGRKSDQTITK